MKEHSQRHGNAYDALDVQTGAHPDREASWPGKLIPSRRLRGGLGARADRAFANGGASLPAGLAARHGALLGQDLSGVRLHAGGEASALAGSLGAVAFARGHDIALAPGFDLESSVGQHVMAHELVHVAQHARGGGAAARDEVGPAGSSIESEAELGAAALTSGRAFSVGTGARMPGFSLFRESERGNIPARLDQMADPAAAQRYTTLHGTVDALRLQAMQFAYQSPSIWRAIGQSFLPTEALREHGRQAGGEHVYNGGNLESASGAIEMLQGQLEVARSYIRIVGDLASAVGAWTGFLGIIADAILVVSAFTGIGALLGGAIKKITDAVGAIPFLLRAVTDLLDVLIGIVQLVLLYQRLKRTTNPAERARIAQQVKKEAGDITQALTSMAAAALAATLSMVVSASLNTVSGGLTRAIGARRLSGNGAGVRQLSREFGRQFRAAASGTWQLPVSRGSIANTTREAQRAMPRQLRIQQLRRSIERRNAGNAAPLPVVSRIMADPTTASRYTRTLLSNSGFITSQISAYNIGTIVSAVQADSKGRRPTEPTQSGRVGNVDGPTARISETTDRLQIAQLAMWPAQLARFRQLQTLLAPAKVKVLEGYRSAKQDLDPATAQQFEQLFGRVTQENGRLRSEALHQRMQSQHQQPQIEQARANVQRGQTAQAGASRAQQQATGQANEVRGAATQLQPVAEPTEPAEQRGPVRSVVDWAYDNTVGRAVNALNQGIANLQANVQSWITSFFANQFSPEELQMAGLEAELGQDQQREQQIQQQASEAETASTRIEADLARLREARTLTEQRAMEASLAAMQMLEELDQADATLTELVANGEAYIRAAIEQLQHEEGVENAGSSIDERFVAPIVESVDEAIRRLEGLAEDVRAQARDLLEATLRRFTESTQGTQIVATTRAAGTQRLDAIGALHAQQVGIARTALGSIVERARAFVGTTDYDGVHALAEQAQRTGNQQLQAVDEIQGRMGELIAHVERTLAAAITNAHDTASGVAPATLQAAAPAAPSPSARDTTPAREPDPPAAPRGGSSPRRDFQPQSTTSASRTLTDSVEASDGSPVREAPRRASERTARPASGPRDAQNRGARPRDGHPPRTAAGSRPPRSEGARRPPTPAPAAAAQAPRSARPTTRSSTPAAPRRPGGDS